MNNTISIKKGTLKNFLVNSGYVPAFGFLTSVEDIEKKLKTASNPYAWNCGDVRMTIEEDIVKFTKHILWMSSDWRKKGNESFVDGFVDVTDSSACLDFIESLVRAIPDVLMDIEYDKYSFHVA